MSGHPTNRNILPAWVRGFFARGCNFRRGTVLEGVYELLQDTFVFVFGDGGPWLAIRARGDVYLGWGVVARESDAERSLEHDEQLGGRGFGFGRGDGFGVHAERSAEERHAESRGAIHAEFNDL